MRVGIATKKKPSQVFAMIATATIAETTTKMLGITKLTKPIAGSKKIMISNYDKKYIDNILSGDGDWFTARLLRLISRADHNNLELLRKGFPEEVEVVETYRNCE